MANVSYLKPQERQNVGLTPVSLLSSLRKTTETLKAPEVKMAEASYLREQEKKKLSQDINQSTKRTVSQVLNFGKDVLQGIARSGGSVGMTLATPIIGTKELAIDKKAPVWQQKLQKIVFGTEPVKTIQTRIAEGEQELKTKGLPIIGGKSVVGGKAALPLSVLGIGAMTALDFSGAGGEKNAIKLLAKTNKVEGVVNILKKMKVADNLIPDISKQIAKTTDEKVVKNILSNLNNKTGMVSPFSRLTQDLKTEKGFLATNIDGKNKFFVSERDANNFAKVSAEKSFPEATLPKAIPKSIAEIPQKPPLQLASKIPEIDEELSSLQKITNALKEAKPIRKAQEALYTKERGAKMAKAITVSERGESGFYKELGALKGELPKVEFESLRNKVSQVDVDNLFNQVKDSQVLNFWDKISTRGAVAKMLEGRVPTERELYLLNRVFPKELVDTILSKRDLFTKFKEAGYQLANVPRSVMASFDLSAPFRQGLFLMSHPKRFFGSFLNMFKSLGGENAFKAGQEAIARKSTFDLMDEGKLALTEMDTILTAREERFASQWAEKIPIVGKAIRASGRAYTGFLNKLRADVFDDLIVKADKIGLMPRSNPDLVKQVANFVNVASGRGSLGSLQPAANALNAFFFSPRLMASRLTLLNPLYYIKADPFVRKEALKSLFTFAGVTTTVLGLAKLGGAEVGYDPRSADFGKIKIGNTRIDIMGGTQQYIRMAAQLITGKYISTTTGKEITLGEGYKPLTRLDILVRQVESKEAPIFSFITDLMRGQDYAGNKIKISKEIGSRFVPMLASDIYDIAKDDPSLLPVGVLGGLGFSVQTYAPQIKFSQPILNEIKRLQTLKLGQTSGLAGYMPEYEGVKDNKALHKNAEEIVNNKIEKLLVVPAYKNLTDEEKAKKISQFVDKAKIDARAQMVLKLTKDLKGQDLKNKLSELKKGGLMTEEVYNKFLELRTAQ